MNNLVEEVFKELSLKIKRYPFDINGSDERQYSSQFFKINICSIFKDKYYEYKQYHSSEDNLKFVKAENIFKTLKVYQKLIEKIENQTIYKTVNTKCETFLSKYNLYPNLGGKYVPKNRALTDIDIILNLVTLNAKQGFIFMIRCFCE